MSSFGKTRRVCAASVAVLCTAGTLAACGSSSSSSGGGSTSGSSSGGSSAKTSSKAGGSFTFLGNSNDATTPPTLKALAAGPCKSVAEQHPLQINLVPQTSLDQKIQLLAGQKALPDMFDAPNAPQLAKELIKAGDIADITKELASDNLSDSVVPAAQDTLKKLYDTTDIDGFPSGLNIEGIWYNKQLFKAHGIAVPTTWPALVADMAKFKAAGIQPVTADGQDGWPITRWVGAYIFRTLGPEALQAVADGKAKLTDPSYVKAADAIGALGKAGYFGSSTSSTSFDQSVDTFMNGKAAMIYQGSWVLSNFQSPSDHIGIKNIGFMRFPSVPGGQGNIDQLPVNVGEPLLFSANDVKNSASQAWLKCIGENFGDEALSKLGSFSGFKTSGQHKLTPLDRLVSDEVSKAPSTVLWFEALFSAQATNVSQQNASLLISGQQSGSAFMSKVQAALNAGG